MSLPLKDIASGVSVEDGQIRTDAAPHMCVSRSKVSEGNTPDAAICSIAAAIRWFELACKQFLNGDLGPDISETLHTSEFIAT